MSPKTTNSSTGSSSGGGGGGDDPATAAAATTLSYPSSSYASTALALMSQDWSELSLGDDPVTAATSDLDRIVDRVTALLLIRIVAIVADRQDADADAANTAAAAAVDAESSSTSLLFPDFSTSTICRHVLLKRSRMKKEKQRAAAAAAAAVVTAAAATSVSSSSADGSSSAALLSSSSCWPKDITTQVVDQLKEFVKRMLKGYKDVPYHSCEHAYHVIVSTNKLLDIMICPTAAASSSTMMDTTTCNNKAKKSSSTSTSTNRLQMQLQQHLQLHSGSSPGASSSHQPPIALPPTVTFGLRHNPLAQFSLVFAALVHDVEHQGIPNRQLAMEDDRLAILYNDQSIAENWSLYVAFSEFLQDEFALLRRVVFGGSLGGASASGVAENDNTTVTTSSSSSSSSSCCSNNAAVAKENYRIFRKHVVNLVLHTDIASPERTQVGKSKWKEAFGEPHETVEAKVRHRLRQLQSSQPQSSSNNKHAPPPMQTTTTTRRLTNESAYSEITFTPSDNMDGGAGGGEGKPMESPPNVSFRKTLGGSNSNKLLQSSSFSGDDDDDEDDGQEDSMSGTPDNSIHGGGDDDIAEQTQQTTSNSKQLLVSNKNNPSTPQAQHQSAEKISDLMLSTHSVRSGIGQSASASTIQKFGRRMSNSSQVSGRYRQRLGILRTVDLSGETLETYSRHGSINNASTTSMNSSGGGGGNIEYHFSSNGSIATAATSALIYSSHFADGNNNSNSSNRYQPNHREADEPDELRMSVVMETIMTAADVAHNLQGWAQMAKWSGRLYQELRKAHVAGRGPDVSTHWFENQIGFLESYLLPLARRLEDMGVFGEEMGSRFAHIVEENRDKWLTEGYDLTEQTILEGAKRFPMHGSEQG